MCVDPLVPLQKTYFKGDKMRADEGEGDYTVWDFAKNEGFMAGDIPGQGGYPAWLRDVVKDGGLPFLEIDRDVAGKEESRFEATKIEAKRLDDSLFALLNGFSVQVWPG